MLENTGTPSAGQPLVAKFVSRGLQFGEEKGRRPTRLIGVSAVGVMVDPSGKVNFIPAGTVRLYGLSSPKMSQLPSIAIMSRQVCGFPAFKSVVASKR